jgi:hypothetical protein
MHATAHHRPAPVVAPSATATSTFDDASAADLRGCGLRVVSPDKISPCTIGLCGPLHGGYQDSILEDNILEDSILEDSILGQHIRLAS